MRSLVVFGAGHASPWLSGSQSVTVDATTVRCAIARTPAPPFDPSSPEDVDRVAVRIRGFSCNYRDRAFIYAMRGVPADRFLALGSEFIGEVIACGPRVEDLRPGDRVIPDHHYTGGGTDARGITEGVITNHASREHQVYPAGKLMKIPDAMPLHTAAAFSLSAQTAYAIVRRLALDPGVRVLVTSATSNTSLCLISVLRRAGARVFGTTRDRAAVDRLRAHGLEEAFVLDPDERFADSVRLQPWSDALGGFDAVADPFFDLHVERAMALLQPGGRYITCGFAGQNPEARRASSAGAIDAVTVFRTAITKNLTLIGNCLGHRADLARALADYQAGALDLLVDSVFEREQAAPFVRRTFTDRQRFGKVVFRYDD
jgi:NADPH:quinone reductase-like Zn-dependent oxidoreductase